MLAMLAACAFDPSGLANSDAGGDTTDAPTTDAAPNTPDADPNTPDADPNAPDADPSAPDASPGTPDASPAIDATPPSFDAACAWPYDPLHFDPCGVGNPDPGPTLTLDQAGTYTYDTDTGLLTTPSFTVSMPTSSTVAGGRAIWLAGLNVDAAATLRELAETAADRLRAAEERFLTLLVPLLLTVTGGAIGTVFLSFFAMLSRIRENALPW